MAAIKGFTVALAGDATEEHAERIRQAILLMRDVEAVKEISTDASDYINRQQIRREFREKMWDVLAVK